MNKTCTLFAVVILTINCVYANNISVGTPVMADVSPLSQTVFIEFDIAWENSWRNAENWDAAWVFVKYKDASGVWHHVYLDTHSSAHEVQNNNGVVPAITVGTNVISGVERGVGVFLYREAVGTGSIDWENVRLKWHYGADGVANHDTVEIAVFAIEMVYVPQGSFTIGDGSTSSLSRFHSGEDINTPYNMTDAPVNFSSSPGGLWAVGAWDAPVGTLDAAYPTGYQAFYAMKYGITQKQYVAFLNTLTRTQQQMRTATDLSPGISSVTDVFVMSESTTPLFRNGIRCDASIHPHDPVTFYCDLNNNGIMSEIDDGQHIACNYLSWGDGVAYAAWAGLRPMTETEYEKICRGTQAHVAGEFAWGSTTVTGASTINNDGMPDETLNAGANCVFDNAAGVPGPVRVGAFAGTATTRVQAGASYYGAMEMSGNLWERTISLGAAAGRNFNGTHGHGTLSAQGEAVVSSWPGENAVGSGFRGGHWRGTVHNMSVSGRDNATFETSIRNELFGFRAVRSE